ncbi:MAG: HAMP domain-containing protein [Anaerolineales bacterium]|nr:HAMP domain-containing protein [Anaerolineales bacterium]
MNRLWIRISLTYIAIMIFVIVIPVSIGIYMHFFDANRSLGLNQTESSSPEIIGLLSLDAPDSSKPGALLVSGLLRFLVSVTVIGIIVGVISSRGLTAPLNKLVDAAKAVGAKNLSRRVEVQGSEEIRAVAQAFNEMTADLEKAETMRSNLLNDVAHELRTPITVIQGSLRAILDDVYDLDKAEIARLYDQTRHLSRLVDDLRELAQAEANQLPLNLVPMEVVPWVQETVVDFRPISAEKDIRVEVEILAKNPIIQADQARLTQCLHNLLNNALQHTPPGGIITVLVEQRDNVIFLRVQDNGEGIETEHIPSIFDRFYRADPMRARKTGGAGLGLAITRAIVVAHNGKIDVHSDGPGKGSTFTIQLPILERS